MTLVNFVVALAVPRLTRRFGNTALLAVGIAITMLGMAWLSRLSADSPYLTGIALPMVLIGAGQGIAFGPLTAAGIAGVAPRDAGAASGLVNVAHQLGGSLGLGILVAIAATAGTSPEGTDATVAQHVARALTAGSLLLALALAAVLALMVHRRRSGRPTRLPRSHRDRVLESLLLDEAGATLSTSTMEITHDSTASQDPCPAVHRQLRTEAGALRRRVGQTRAVAA